MLLTFISIPIVILTLFVILRYTLFPLLQLARTNKRLLREGQEAKAVLLNMEQTGVYVNNRPQIKLQLQVHPLSGRNFVSETRAVLTMIDLSQLRIGSTLKVKYNPANTKEVVVLRNESFFS
jgi:sRNA-binding protein